jgi:hypothetical protein
VARVVFDSEDDGVEEDLFDVIARLAAAADFDAEELIIDVINVVEKIAQGGGII